MFVCLTEKKPWWMVGALAITDSLTRGDISLWMIISRVSLASKRKEKCPKHHTVYSRSQWDQASTVQADLQQFRRRARPRATRRTQAWAARGTGRTWYAHSIWSRWSSKVWRETAACQQIWSLFNLFCRLKRPLMGIQLTPVMFLTRRKSVLIRSVCVRTRKCFLL